MSIQLEFICLIVPVGTIEKKYPGGWARCLADHHGLIGDSVWHDGHLFCISVLKPLEIGSLLNDWESLGFTTFEAGIPTLPCDWIEIDGRCATLKGQLPAQPVALHEMPKDRVSCSGQGICNPP